MSQFLELVLFRLFKLYAQKAGSGIVVVITRALSGSSQDLQVNRQPVVAENPGQTQVILWR